MADIGVNFDLTYTPNPIGVDVNLSITGNKTRITIVNVPGVLVGAIPHFSGNIVESAISVILTPVANAVTSIAGAFANNILSGKSFDGPVIPQIPISVQGFTVRINPKDLQLGNFNGQLLITGDIDIS